jgi:hypothetical protein
VSPIVAHIAGVPAEEGVLALAPAGLATVCVLAGLARARIAEVTAWLRRR